MKCHSRPKSHCQPNVISTECRIRPAVVVMKCHSMKCHGSLLSSSEHCGFFRPLEPGRSCKFSTSINVYYFHVEY